MPMNEIAWIRATHPDAKVRNPPEAVRLAERAAERTSRQQPVILDTLAAAYAAAGDFDRAAATAQEATSLAAAGGPSALPSEIGKRLELYRQKKPFRERAVRTERRIIRAVRTDSHCGPLVTAAHTQRSFLLLFSSK